MRLAPALLAFAASPAFAQYLPPATPEPPQLTEPLLPAIAASGLAVRIAPYVTIPADTPGNGAPAARIDYLISDPSNPARQFVNDTNGTLYSITSGGTPTPYLNLAQQNVGFSNAFDPTSTGFQGIAFNPNFAGDPTKPGYGVFYTTYSALNTGTATNGAYQGQPLTYMGDHAANHVTVLREWTATDPTAATFSGTSRVVMTIGADGVGHNDGSIAFNPTAAPGSADYGNLYVGIGVSGFNDPQLNGGNLANPAGKILRIDPLAGPGGAAYTVPAFNPFVGVAGALPEIYEYGLRYPQSFGWDSKTGAMYINDLGQAGVEEVDLGKAGANYGWPYRQGSFATGYDYGVNNPDDQSIYPIPVTDTGLGPNGIPYTDPIAEYDHSANYAIGSGFLYRGNLMPALDGMYILADIVNGNLFYFDPSTASPGHAATLYSLAIEQNGALVNLLDEYGYNSDFLFSPRLDLRLSQTSDGELDIALKSTGDIFALTAAIPVTSISVAEPAGLLVLLPAFGALAWVRRRGRFTTT